VKIVSKQLVITEGAEEMWRNWQSFPRYHDSGEGSISPPKATVVSSEQPKWEGVAFNTHRLSVPGGWLYRYYYNGKESITFVPDPKVWAGE
jgi:hypothetical protein